MSSDATSLQEAVSSAGPVLLLPLAREAFQHLAVLIRNSYVHDLNNRVFHEPLFKADEALQKLFDLEGSFRLELAGSEFFANGKRLRAGIGSVHAYNYLREEFARLEVGAFEFTEGMTRDSLSGLLRVLGRARSTGQTGPKAINRLLSEERILGLRSLPARQETAELSRRATSDRRQRAIQAYEQALDFIRESMVNLQSPAQLNVRRAKRAVQRLVDLSYEEGGGFSLAGMAAIKAHDNYTFNHMVNVCILAIAFGQRLGLKRQVLAKLGLCALYHDMGKLHIPLEVLNKPAKLTEEEWAIMGNHTLYAARTLFPLIEQDPETVSRILTALQHHLGHDGKGYPKLVVLRRQGLLTRIISIVDTFDAMTTKRLYQKQFLPDEAVEVLYANAGGRYDPFLVKAFINCMGVFPVGSAILLADGELAVVVESNPDPEHVHRPTIRVVTDRDRRFIEPELVDLSTPREAGRRIVGCVDPEAFGIDAARHVL